MSTQMKSPSFIFVAALLVVAPTLAAADWILPKKGTVNEDGFMVVACAQTWYPEVCYNTLSPFASSTNKEPGRLALIALGESVKETQKFSASLSGTVPGVAKASIDACLKSFEQNAATLTNSLAQMQKIVGSQSAQGFEDTLVKIDTQLRAAVNSVSSCADKLKASGNGEVNQGIESLKYGTTNAWNLVAFYFNDQTSPMFS